MNGKRTGTIAVTKCTKSSGKASAIHQEGSFCIRPMEEKRRKKNKYGLPDPIRPVVY